MAEFARAFEIVQSHEGGYAFDPLDRGGETYKGVSRQNHPLWRGWALIDRMRSDPAFHASLENSAELKSEVLSFYREKYWNPLRGSELPCQHLADALFDSAVNLGLTRTVRLLQRSLNALNRNAALYEDLVEDGVFGPRTVAALSTCLANDPSRLLLTCLNIQRGMHYIELMRRRPDQERFARGWLSRLTLPCDPRRCQPESPYTREGTPD
ncbi:MAG: glycoside hydrolase family 108 protein [Candidatus Zixiibacteriota bacterium]